MQKLDIPALEHCLGQSESAETPVCILEGRRQCPLGGAAMLCQEQMPGTFVVSYYFSAQRIRTQSSCISNKGSITEPYPAGQTLALLSHSVRRFVFPRDSVYPENILRSPSLIILAFSVSVPVGTGP